MTTNNLYPQYLERARLWQDIARNAHSLLNFEQLLSIYKAIFQNDEVPIAWLPDNHTLNHANITDFMQTNNLKSYAELYQWSVQHRDWFWASAILALDIQLEKPYTSIADHSEGPENPVWLDGARMNIVDSCFKSAADKTAIIVGDENGDTRTISYGKLQRLTNQVASGLAKLGLSPKDSVILYLPLCAEAVACYLGIIKAGMAAVLVADSFSTAELKSRAAMSNASLIITVDGYLYGGKPLHIYNKIKEADIVQSVVIPLLGKCELNAEDLLWKDFLGDEDFSSYITDPYNTTSILFSSGTTKEPKAIPWTHLTPVKCAADAYFHHDVHPTDVITWTTGMGWMMGPWLIYAALINRATMALFTGSAASESFGKFVQDTKVTILGTVPSLVKVWKKTKVMEPFSWKVRVFSSTGEPSNAEDYFYLMWLSGFKAPVIEYCGGTEIGGGYITGSVVQPASPALFTTPALGIDLKFLNENSQPCKPGETGEVFLVPPSIGLSQTLLNRDHHREYFAGMPVDEEGNRLRKHGDTYKLLPQRYEGTQFYKSQGRADDVMNLGGIKVSAVEIEKVLNKHEAVFESAAIGVPPPDSGPEQLIVYYIPKKEVASEENLKKELQKMLSANLNPLFKIAEIRPQTSLPRTASNKLMRRVLKKEYLEGR